MNNFGFVKFNKKLALLGGCAGAIMAMCYKTKNFYLNVLGSYMVGVLINIGYKLGQLDAREKEMNDLNEVRTELSEKFKTE